MALLEAASGATILQYINTAAAVATFLISERLPATVSNISNFFKRKEKEIPKDFDPDEAKELVALLVIDPDLLDTIKGKINEALDAYNTCLRQASRPQESAACDRRAERDVCDALNRIRDRNNDQLPSDYLENQWSSFGCVRV